VSESWKEEILLPITFVASQEVDVTLFSISILTVLK
jgi:hypothetical protein